MKFGRRLQSAINLEKISNGQRSLLYISIKSEDACVFSIWTNDEQKHKREKSKVVDILKTFLNKAIILPPNHHLIK